MPFPKLSLSILCAALLAGPPALGAIIPYTENFDNDPVGTAAPAEGPPESGTFVESTDSQWTVVSTGITGNSYRNAYTTDNTPSTALIDFTGSLGGAVATASNFVITTQLRFNAGTTAGTATSTAGIGFLMTSSGSGTGYFVDLGQTGLVRIVEGGTILSSFDRGTATIGDVYTMTLTGTYSDSNADLTSDQLSIAVSVSGTGMDSTPVTFTDTTPTGTGTFFGYRQRTGTTDIDVDFDDLSIDVPEPTTSTLLLILATATLSRRRR